MVNSAQAPPPDAIRVVVCDDSTGFRALVGAWLRADDELELVGAVSGGEALKDAVATLHPDVALLDLVLPDVDDPTALIAELRATAPDLRVVMMSSLLTDELEREATAAHADAFSHKATTGPKLCELLRQATRGPMPPVAG